MNAWLSEHAPLSPVLLCPRILAHQATDVFSLWHRWEEYTASTQGPPFWAVVWPAAALLAQFLHSNPELVHHKRVLDIGCGGAVPAIAAAQAGALSVILNDIDETALTVARANCRANDVSARTCVDNLLCADTPLEADVILVAELFYHGPTAAVAERRLRRFAKNDGMVLIADGARAFTPALHVEVLIEREVEANRDLEGVDQRRCRILRLLPDPV